MNMNCPVCEERLRDVERAGVTISLCPGCKGAWLDRGELAKLAGTVSDPTRPYAGAAGGTAAVQGHSGVEEQRNELRDRRDRREYEDDENEDGGQLGQPGGKRKRGGFFESIGDLFGD
jgi:Zn-finger nucleic acid-binding protein